ncbi:MAG: L-rhamnose/proton symporter RhaT [Candidatus Solibacter usitatus]|nr:L-rhamnose/proton symporter RhaT [Candidatus Solibacter usitatus]
MHSNPALGVFFHWLGGLASGSFYVPYKGVQRWSWETYWLVGGFFSWILAPWILASIMTSDLIAVLKEAPAENLTWCYIFGALWGLGGLTFGLTMRYLGMSLGMAVALGYCAAFGTLMPPIFRGDFVPKVLHTASGQTILIGIVVCLAGIGAAGLAGMSKEKEMSAEKKKEAIREFDLKKGILVATFSGIMSACFSYGLAAGDPIKEITLRHGTTQLWQGLPVLVVVLLGGFTTNFIWCMILNRRNGTGYEYFSPTVKETSADGSVKRVPAPRLRNLLFCALAGTTWYMQFFFYSMGETQMGDYKFSSWTLHMASIIIFSTLWGIALHEWRGASGRTLRLVILSLALLVGSTVVVGYGNYLAG